MKLFGFTIIRTEDREAEIASRDREIRDLRDWLSESGHKRVAAENEVVHLREALWLAQAGNYQQSKGDGVELPEKMVIAYREVREWTLGHRTDLQASVTISMPRDDGEADMLIHRLANSICVDFRGLAWKATGMTRQQEQPHGSRFEIEMIATADPTESVPDFKRGYTGR